MGCGNQCGGRYIHRRSFGQSVRKLSALPRYEFGKSRQSVFWVSAGKGSFGGRSSECHPQFAATATSSHPVTHPRSSSLPQPSLLSTMLDLNGGTTHGRTMGNQTFCTDCHNSDDNREFGGIGPSGPHGSTNKHILERDYEFSQAPGPGQLITNLYPTLT